jgi:hypothetical protein
MRTAMRPPHSETYAFISHDGSGQSASDRMRVRSHCMRGRNKRPDSRRSLREDRRARVRLREVPSGCVDGDSDTDSVTAAKSSISATRESDSLTRECRGKTKQLLSPSACFQDMALIPFAEDLDARSHGLLFKSEQAGLDSPVGDS